MAPLLELRVHQVEYGLNRFLGIDSVQGELLVNLFLGHRLEEFDVSIEIVGRHETTGLLDGHDRFSHVLNFTHGFDSSVATSNGDLDD
ncbi:MAG TPA: hypothetical protein VF215_15730 [Thermoanaerobaculia bacterium]